MSFPKLYLLFPAMFLVLRSYYRSLLALILIFLLNACSTATPPLEFAPNGEIIQKAIALGLEQTEQHLSQRLNASRPEFEISQINVKKIEPVVVANLPTYHLQGNYNLTLTLPRQTVTQQKKSFRPLFTKTN